MEQHFPAGHDCGHAGGCEHRYWVGVAKDLQLWRRSRAGVLGWAVMRGPAMCLDHPHSGTALSQRNNSTDVTSIQPMNSPGGVSHKTMQAYSGQMPNCCLPLFATGHWNLVLLAARRLLLQSLACHWKLLTRFKSTAVVK